MGIDINRIKQYNNRVNEGKQKVAQDRAEIELTRKEIKRLCGELSEELGIEVNEQNIEQIYNEHVQNIMTQVENGEQILNRIDAAENGNVASTNNFAEQGTNLGEIGRSTYGSTVGQQMQQGQFNQQFAEQPVAGQTFAGQQFNQPEQQIGEVKQPTFQGIPQGMPQSFGFPTQFQVGKQNNTAGNTGNGIFSI